MPVGPHPIGELGTYLTVVVSALPPLFVLTRPLPPQHMTSSNLPLAGHIILLTVLIVPVIGLGPVPPETIVPKVTCGPLPLIGAILIPVYEIVVMVRSVIVSTSDTPQFAPTSHSTVFGRRASFPWTKILNLSCRP